MKNIELSIKINEDINKYYGIIDSNIIRYKDDNSKVVLDMNDDRLIRISNEKYMVLDFKKEKVHIKMKELNYDIDLDIKVISMDKEINTYRVKYSIENEEFDFELKIKE